MKSKFVLCFNLKAIIGQLKNCPSLSPIFYISHYYFNVCAFFPSWSPVLLYVFQCLCFFSILKPLFFCIYFKLFHIAWFHIHHFLRYGLFIAKNFSSHWMDTWIGCAVPGCFHFNFIFPKQNFSCVMNQNMLIINWLDSRQMDGWLCPQVMIKLWSSGTETVKKVFILFMNMEGKYSRRLIIHKFCSF